MNRTKFWKSKLSTHDMDESGYNHWSHKYPAISLLLFLFSLFFDFNRSWVIN